MIDSNNVINDDCLQVLKEIDDKSINMVYLDPPFYTQKIHSHNSKLCNIKYSFSDKWNCITDYITFLRIRLQECKRVLTEDGNIFLHCDSSASHYLRQILDEVFGYNFFQSEIVWVYKRWSNSKKGLLSSHQIIYHYSKTNDFKFNVLYGEYSPTTNIDQIFQKRRRDENGISIYDTLENDNLMPNKKGVPLSDVWYIPYLNPKAKERSGYPTQKPILLLEQIIKISTDENDLILDPFAGSGTTLVAAKLLGRKYIGIDISREACLLCNQRLSNPIKTESELLTKGHNSFYNQDQEVTSKIKYIYATPVQRNNGIDGFVTIEKMIKPIPIRIQRDDETKSEAIHKLSKASLRNKFKLLILITNNTNIDTLFGECLDPKIIIFNSLDEYKENIKCYLENK